MRSRSSSPAGLLFTLALLALGCQGDDITNEFATGQLTVVTTTAGDVPDPDGYTVQVDEAGAQPIDATGQLQFNGLESGEHSVTLSGIAANCIVAEGLTQTATVSEPSMATVRYTVTCSAVTPTGGLTVGITTSGEDPDFDGYTVQVDQDGPQPISIFGTRQYTGLSAGSHRVTLAGVAPNCSVVEGLIQNVTVSERSTATVRYTVTCRVMNTPMWARIPLPPSVQANGGLWGTSPSDLFVTGYTENPSPRYGIWHYDGSGWTGQVSRADTSFNAFWGFSATDVYAVGGRATREFGQLHAGAILHYDGSRWTDVSAPAVSDGSPGFRAVWGTSPQDVFIAGQAEGGTGLVGHFDGRTWSKMTISDPAPECLPDGCRTPSGGTGFADLSGTSSSDVWVIGNRQVNCETCWGNGTVGHFDGSSWTNPREHWFVTYLAVWASAPNDVWIVGTDGDFPVLYHSDGVYETLQGGVSDTFQDLRDVWGSAPSDVYAVGLQVLLHYDGSSWSKISGEGGFRVWGTSQNDVFVLRANEILHFKR
ncbi:MAG TPA: hypothetical protein VFZ87_00835 [Gemmatimonadales bacterium]